MTTVLDVYFWKRHYTDILYYKNDLILTFRQNSHPENY